jgi:sulfofructose kinase
MSLAERSKKVVGLGLACLDQLYLWQDMSRPVADNRIVDHQVQGGGMTGTALVAVARLGGQAEYWGAVGEDWMAELVLEGLRQEGVALGHVQRVSGGKGPMVVVCVDQPTGQRHFLYSTGWKEPAAPIGSEELLQSAGCLLVDGIYGDSALRMAKAARRLGVSVVGDLEASERTRELLAYVDYAILSADHRGRLAAGEDWQGICRSVAAMGPAHVIVTRGQRGLAYLSAGRFGEIDAFAVDVVDTTGAGDTFHGAFCYGLAQGFELARNLVFSSAVAAMKCRKMGGRAGIPTRGEVADFLRCRGVAWQD